MNHPINITSNSKIRILLVPILPIKKSVFKKYLDIFRKYEQDANVLPSNSKRRKLSFEFITNDNHIHSYLEEFQPHRQIFGVIGLIDYQDWKSNKQFCKGYQKYQELLEKYPKATARCFVFNNSMAAFDLIPTLIFFNQHFNVCMSTFENDILNQISVKMERTKSYQIIESPIPPSFSAGFNVTDQKKSRISSNSSTVSSSLRSSIFSLPPSPTLSSTTTFSLVNNNLTKQRTPGRVQKLLADFYLLSGDLVQAEEVYKNAIELSKPFYDYLWIASAKEGIACIAILNTYYSSKNPENSHNTSLDNKDSNDTSRNYEIVKETVIDLYEHIMYYYLLVDTPSVVYAEACLKIARFLAMAFLHSQVDVDILSNIIYENKILIRQGRIATTKDLIKCKKSKIRRFSIAKWITKIWLVEMNDISLIEQIHLMAQMSFVLSNIGYHRKAAWFISKTLDKILYFTIQNDLSLVSNHDDIIILMEFMCQLHNIQEKKDTDYEVPNGWTIIQLDVLKQCVILSEALQDGIHIIYYATLLLKNMSKYLSEDEQIYYVALIHRSSSMNQLTSNYSLPDIKYIGPTVLMCIEYTPPLSWKAIYKNTFKDKVESKEPFYHNPFLKKKKKEEFTAYVVKNQECQFKVILGNPFNYDIEISSIFPRTCGVEFSPVLSSPITIAANEVISLDLTGTPVETGLLEVQGCLIKLKGFTEAEFFSKVHSCTALDSYNKMTYNNFQSIKYLPEQECKLIQSVQVIEEQPLLNIKSTSIIDKSITLFEGEKFIFHLQIENIGTIPVNYISFSFTESNYLYSDMETLSNVERYEMDLKVAEPLFSWVNNDKSEILPGQSLEMEVSTFGKFGCTNGEICIEYGYSTESEYIRLLYLPISISVYQPLQLSNWHVSRLYPKMNDKLKKDIERTTLEEQLERAVCSIDPLSKSSTYFLLSFDVCNSWPVAFVIEFDVDNSDDESFNQKLIILPGQTKRIVLPMKKLYLSPENAVEPIPNKQQIVVSQESKSGRALFWYQQLLLKRIKARWSENNRKGHLELGSPALSSAQLDILKEQNIKFHISMKNVKKQTGYRSFQCDIYTSTTLDITIFNRHDHPVKLILRIQPTQRYDDDVRDYDLTEKLLLEGLTQLVLPEIPAGGSISHSLPLIFISCGHYEFIHHIENVHTREILFDHDWVYIHAITS